MYMIVGYNLMYPGGGTGVIPELAFFLGEDNTAEAVIASGGDVYYSGISDHFFQAAADRRPPPVLPVEHCPRFCRHFPFTHLHFALDLPVVGRTTRVWMLGEFFFLVEPGNCTACYK